MGFGGRRSWRGACGPSGEGVEQDSEREREDALGDAEGESGWGAGEVAFKVHLLFEAREDALDDEAGRGECALAAEVGGGAGLVRA